MKSGDEKLRQKKTSSIFSYSCRNKIEANEEDRYGIYYLFQHHLNGSPGFCPWCWTIFWQRPWTMRAEREIRRERVQLVTHEARRTNHSPRRQQHTSNLAFLPTPIFHCFRMSSCNWLRHLIEHQEEATPLFLALFLGFSQELDGEAEIFYGK